MFHMEYISLLKQTKTLYMKIQEFLKQEGIDKMSHLELGNLILSIEDDIKKLINAGGSIDKIEQLNKFNGILINLYMKK